MKYAILITAANIVFWVALHFGTAAFFTYALPEKTKNRLFDYNKRFFTVSEKEMRFYRKIKLPFWKDKLPQFNKDFNKRNLESEITPEYIKRFLLQTCKAETIHYTISILGFLSLLFCLLEKNPVSFLPLYSGIALLAVICNLPFSLIQRYNRYRLLKVYNRIASVQEN